MPIETKFRLYLSRQYNQPTSIDFSTTLPNSWFDANNQYGKFKAASLRGNLFTFIDNKHSLFEIILSYSLKVIGYN